MRLRSIVALGTLALALTSVVGCSADSGEETAASEEQLTIAAEQVATDADADKTVRVYEGQDFVLKLGANATTGYAWKVTRTTRSLAYPFASTYEASGPTGPVGSGGTAVFKWHTNPVTDVTGTPLMSKVGKHQIKLEYRRPWEAATAPAAKTFNITIDIVPVPDVSIPPPVNNGTCGDDTCGDNQECQFCWGQLACIPRGALC